MPLGMRLLAGLLLASLAAVVAARQHALTRSGAIVAALLGTIILGFGGWSWGLTLGVCFGLTSLFSFIKQQMQQHQGRAAEGGRCRGTIQVVANGGAMAALALAYAALGQPLLILAAFAGTLAAPTADTWASDLGIFSSQHPRKITTGEHVEPGTSGGVTLFGTLISAGAGLLPGGLLLGFTALLRPAETLPWWLLPTALAGGLAGSLADSLLGATLQAHHTADDGSETEHATAPDGTPNTHMRGWRWMTNDTVNAISSLVGGGVAVLVAVPFI